MAMPQRTMSWCANGKRSVAALLAACEIAAGERRRTASANGMKRSSWEAVNSSSSSALEKWVIAPANSSRGAAAATRSATASARRSSRVPSRPMPVSSLTCTRSGGPALASSASMNSWLQATSSALAASATGSSSALMAPITRTVASIPSARSAIASSTVATASIAAPPASAARAAGTAPWPYPSPFTTAHRRAPGGRSRRSRVTLRWIAATLTRASARTIFLAGQRLENVDPGDDAQQLALRIDHREPVVLALGDQLGRLLHRGVGSDGYGIRGHHVRDLGGEGTPQALLVVLDRLEE